MSETKQLMRILCIHGYRQNAQSFREKTGSFRKVLKKYADFTFITAHHRVPPGNLGSAAWGNQDVTELVNTEEPVQTVDQSQDSKAEGQSTDSNLGERGWWFSREDDYFKSTDVSDCDKGFTKSLEQVISVLEGEDGNFDGILGFSQGASLVSILCSLQHQQKKQWFKFAVLISGFKSPSLKHDHYYQDILLPIPSLHVYGKGDNIVTYDRSENLSTFFDNPKCLSHPGGHFVAATGAQKQTYLEFFEEMKALCFS